MPLIDTPAHKLAQQLLRRELSAEEVARGFIERIEERETEIGAWAHLNHRQVLERARALDRGPILGPLHGLPLGVKDNIDTVDFPTEIGTPIYAGRQPVADAACVALAKAAGAIVMGKTVTTELAYSTPGKTRNPHNTAYTPGGSSSGSAAGVSSRMVPLAVGTQTAGSVIRPAAYCGVVAFKPSYGLIARAGIKLASENLDTIGIFARHVRDAGLLASTLTARPALADPRLKNRVLRVAICRMPDWASAQPETVALFDALAGRLRDAGIDAPDYQLPALFDESSETQRIVMAFEMAQCYSHELHAHRARLSAPLVQLLTFGESLGHQPYDMARRHARDCRNAIKDVFRDWDVLITPSATGEAPRGLSSTGDPVFNRLWSLVGTPVVTVPAGVGPNGLPLGVQIVARFGGDEMVLAAAERIGDVLR